MNGTVEHFGPSHDTFRSLLRLGGSLRRVMEPFFLQYGISGAQWGVLRALWRAEQEGLKDLRAADLTERLLIRPPSVSGVIDRLDRQKLIQRTASSDDHRAKRIRLTPRGRKLIPHVLEGLSQKIPAVLGGLTSADQVRLEELLGKLMRHLDSIAQHAEELDTNRSKSKEV